MAIDIDPTETRIKRIVESLREVIRGRGFYVGTVTLNAGQTSTSVSFINCSSSGRVFLQAQNAAAAAAAATVAQADIANGSFVIRHPSAASGCIFSFACIGG